MQNTPRKFLRRLIGTAGLMFASQTAVAHSCPDLFDLKRSFDNPTAAISDLFGYEVEANKFKVAIGSKQDDTGAFNSGVVHLFNSDTGKLLLTIENPFPNKYDHFGDRLAFVGTRLAVGAHYNNRYAKDAGAVYIFSQYSGRLLQQIYSPTPDENDLFGFALATLGEDRLVVGSHRDDTAGADSGAAYIYDTSSGTLLHTLTSPTPESEAFFGISMATVGNVVIVGAHYEDSAANNGGAAYMFDANTGQFIRKLVSPNPTENGKFGYAMSAVGNHVVIGAFADGENASGASYMFDMNGNLVHTFTPPSGQANAEFGYSIGQVGAHVIIGAPKDGPNGAGQAYLFDGITGQLLYTFVNPHPDGGGNYGYTVSAAGSHNIVIGSPRDDTTLNNSGYAFVYGGCTRLSGSVYIDDNDNGIRNREEYGLYRAKVQLDGIDRLGAPVSWSRLTNRSGFYSFGNLQPGEYTITETQPQGYVDGQDTPGTVGGSTPSNDVIQVTLGDGDHADRYNFGELSPASLSGYVYLDVNDNQAFDAGDRGIAHVDMALNGTENSGRVVSKTSATDERGYYVFPSLRPGLYELNETQPEAYRDSVETVGTQGGVAGNDVISQIQLAADAQGEHYNFGELESLVSTCGAPRTKSKSFWLSDDGKDLIEGLHGDKDDTSLAQWMATSYPQLYGVSVENDIGAIYKLADDGSVDEYKSNYKMYQTLEKLYDNYYQDDYGDTTLEAEIMATVFAMYVSNINLAGNTIAEQYGFIVDELGAGATSYNVGDAGAAFGVNNNVSLPVADLVNAANNSAIRGIAYADSSDQSHRAPALQTFRGVNDCGGGGSGDDGSDGGTSSGPEMCDNGNPVVVSFTYTAQSCAGSTPFEKSSCSESGTPPQTANIVVTDDNGTLFDGQVSAGGSFSIDARSLSEDSIGKNVVVSVLDGSTQVQELQIHASCSEEMYVGDRLGSVVFESFTGEDEVADSGSGDSGSGDSGTDGGTSSGPEMCDNGKPVVVNFTYTAQSCAGSTPFEKSSCSESGTPPQTANIVVTDDNGTLFQGLVSEGQSFSIDARSLSEDSLGKNIVVSVLDGSTQVQELQIHASCSEEMYVGDRLGSVVFESFTGEDEVADSGSGDSGSGDSGTDAGTSSGPEMCDNGNPVVVSFTYTAQSCAGSTPFEKSSCSESGTPPQTANIVVTDDNGTLFQGLVSEGQSFSIDARSLSEDSLGKNIVVSVLDGSTQVQELQIHASCSEEMYVGDRLGSVVFESFTGEDEVADSGSGDDGSGDDGSGDSGTSSGPEMCDNGNPVVVSFTYTAQSCAGSTPFEKSTCSESGTPPQTANIVVTDDNGTLFDGQVSAGGSFSIDARSLSEDSIGKNVVVSVLDGSTQVQELQIHASCSEEMYVGDRLGSVVFESFTGEDEVADSGSGDSGSSDSGSDGGTDGGTSSGPEMCDNGNPVVVSFTYTAQSCAGSTPFEKSTCSESGTLPQTANIVVNDDNGTLFDGQVSAGGSFSIDARSLSEDSLGKNIVVSVLDGSTQVQELQIHASCSEEMYVGDRLGSVVFESFTGEDEVADSGSGDSGSGDSGSDGGTNAVEMCDNGKPVEVSFTYTAQSCVGSTPFEKSSCSESGTPPQTANILVTDDNGTLFDGQVIAEQQFDIDARDIGQGTLGKNVVISVLDGGTQVQELQIHASCSEEMYVGDRLGSVIFNSFVGEDEVSR